MNKTYRYRHHRCRATRGMDRDCGPRTVIAEQWYTAIRDRPRMHPHSTLHSMVDGNNAEHKDLNVLASTYQVLLEPLQHHFIQTCKRFLSRQIRILHLTETNLVERLINTNFQHQWPVQYLVPFTGSKICNF